MTYRSCDEINQIRTGLCLGQRRLRIVGVLFPIAPIRQGVGHSHALHAFQGALR